MARYCDVDKALHDQVPADLDMVRYWDLSATEKTALNDPDWTVGVKLGRDQNGSYELLDVAGQWVNPGDVERFLLNTATQDDKRVSIGFGEDPGQAGRSQALHLVRALSGFTVTPAAESGDKLTQFGPFSSQCRAGNIKIRKARWNEDLFRVLEGFPDLTHNDEVDACGGALEMLNRPMNSWASLNCIVGAPVATTMSKVRKGMVKGRSPGCAATTGLRRFQSFVGPR
jgi:predicted phage terminase large subunit-like protein